MSLSSAVIGHYVKHGDGLLPALAQSTPLFKGICCDNLEAVQEALAPGPVDQWMSVLVWDAQEAAQHQQQRDTHPDQAAGDQQTAQVQVKPRTLAMIAAFHGSERVLSFLLDQGANPRLRTPDTEALCCYDLIKPGPSGSSMRALLDGAQVGEVEAPLQCTPATTSTACYPLAGSEQDLSRTGSGMSRASSLLDGQQDHALASPAPSQARSSAPATPAPSTAAATPPGTAHAAFSPGAAGMAELEGCGPGQDTAEPGLGYSTKELTRQEYSTDEFRMFCFKVLPCSKRYAHDWRACPFAHPTENARRRDPREVLYSSIACPDYKQGFCIRGDTCQYAHGVFESWLHPSRYRTQLCKDGERCHRPVCFFAHTLAQLRAPTHAFAPGPAERLRVPRELLSAAGAGGAPALSPAAAGAQLSPGHPLPLGELPPLSPDAGLLRDQNLQAAAAAGGGYGQDSPGSYRMSPVHMTPLGGAAATAAVAAAATAAVAAAAAVAPSITVEGPGLLPSAAPPLQQQQLLGSFSPGGTSSTSSGRRRNAPRSGGGAPGGMGLAGPGMMPMPRMSNAFARKHGIDPKHNPLLNVQAIALQQEVHQASRRGRNRQGNRRPHNQAPPPQQHHQQQQQQQQQHYQQQQCQGPQEAQRSPGHASSAELHMALQQLHSPGQQAQRMSPSAQQPVMQGLVSPAHMQQLQLQDQYLLHLQQQQQLAAMHQQQLAAMSPQGQLLSQVQMYGTPGLLPMQDPNSLALLLGGMSMGPAMALPAEVMGAAGVTPMLPQLPLQSLVPVTQDASALPPAAPF